MKKILLAVWFATALFVATFAPSQYTLHPWRPIETPIVNLPLALRQANWVYRGEGSCAHATIVSLLRWQFRFRTAEDYKRTHGGGVYPSTLEAALSAANIRYASTKTGDVSFLDEACRERRGAGIVVMGGRHMVALVHLDGERAGILDNNDVRSTIWIPRETLISEWQNSGGFAVCLLYAPAPLLPR